MERLSDIPIRFIKGVGPKRAETFARNGISSVEDLVLYFPRRYDDRTHFATISQRQEGASITIKARVVTSDSRRSFRRRGFSITRAIVEDATGRLECVWFNQPYMQEYLKPGSELILHGRIDTYSGRFQMNNPEFEAVSDSDGEGSLNIGRIVPIYTLPSGVGQRTLRAMIKSALDAYLDKAEDILPDGIRERHNLMPFAQSIRNIHFPDDRGSHLEAYSRLAFEEFLLFQLPLAVRKLRKRDQPGISHKIHGPVVARYVKALPFELTEAQKLVLMEISADMARPRAMQRLLQGDVGSGKTVVATVAAMMAVQGGYQAALMVPTEILAKQHFEKIGSQLSVFSGSTAPGRAMAGLPAGLKRKITVRLLASGLPRKERDSVASDIKKGAVDIVIGTHALLEEYVQFKNLGLVIIDEQHRFGVGQRSLLPQKGRNPDVLIMTATPIPRTLAITLYGDLDVSVIERMPPGRKPVKTKLITGERRPWMYDFMKQQVRSGRQAYVVYPLIEESLAADLLSAEKMYDEFRQRVFRDFRVGLIHGRMKQSEQDLVMQEFKSGDIQVLIATTVLEVGIDVANATVMVIEHADRFGLSQLHQLRGRVGRGQHESYCILMSDASTDDARARLDAMVKYADGFAIAEEDLKIRGPGEYFGNRQHGLTGLRIGNPLTQMQILKSAREEAIRLVDADPGLERAEHRCLRERLQSRFPEYERAMVVG